MDSSKTQRWKRVATAAARLAIIYTIGVFVLYAPIRFWLLPHAAGLRELPGVSAELGILAAVAFVVLVVARRVGFLLLWALLLAIWVSNFSGPSDLVLPESVAGYFILWTVLALPMYAIAAFGGSDRLAIRVAGRRIRVSEVGSLAWIILIAGAFLYVFVGSPLGNGAWFNMAARFVWLPAPFILALIALASIWVRPTDASVRAA
jgi:hypothetical protein